MYESVPETRRTGVAPPPSEGDRVPDMPSTHPYNGPNGLTGEQQGDDLIAAGEAAKILGVSVSTVQRYDNLGLLPAERTPFTLQRRWRRSDVEAAKRAANGHGLHRSQENADADTDTAA